MADDFDDEAGKPSERGANPAALDAAMAGANSDEAREFLRRQSRLTELQEEILRDEHALEMSHFKWRRFNDQMKGALQILTALFGVALVVALIAAIWSASRADGLVVDAVSVPPRFAEAGMTGEVIADDLTNRIAAVRDTANAHSIAHSKDVKSERDEEIRVEIPDTVVSLAEVWRYLRGWLGHERHLSGNLRATADGGIALTVSLDGANVATFTGRTNDLDRLEQEAAEHVFQGVDPSNYILYLYSQGRSADSIAAIKHLVAISDSPSMRSDGYALWGNWARHFAGDLPLCVERERFAAAIDPKALPPHMELMFADQNLGHDEDALREARNIPNFRQEDQYAWREGGGFADVMATAAVTSQLLTGDFAAATSQPCGLCNGIEEMLGRAEYAARAHDIAKGRALIDEARSSGTTDREDMERAQYFVDRESGDWQKAVADARGYAVAIGGRSDRLRAVQVRAFALPLLAVALANAGDFAQAHAEIDKTAADCVACITARGDIAALEGNTGAAAFWFAKAVEHAPSVPFADTDWGRMLLRQGRYDAAIAKFKAAHDKGPHFADPLEMWGEALMQKNRSDLALAKFEEANKYAPKWGRLHLKWGEALAYAGHKDAAEKQFVQAAGLTLSAGDRAALSRVAR
jgi:tetratricopeptide (TPR) repeat protein